MEADTAGVPERGQGIPSVQEVRDAQGAYDAAMAAKRFPRAQGLAAGLAVMALAAGLGLAGCGGGVYIGYDYSGGDDRPPQVSLAASPGAAAPGQAVTLVAAASDDHRVVRVEFFRLEPNGNAVALGSDASAPFQLETLQPVTSATSVRYFARAVDDVGQYDDSPSVSVTVLR